MYRVYSVADMPPHEFHTFENTRGTFVGENLCYSVPLFTSVWIWKIWRNIKQRHKRYNLVLGLSFKYIKFEVSNLSCLQNVCPTLQKDPINNKCIKCFQHKYRRYRPGGQFKWHSGPSLRSNGSMDTHFHFTKKWNSLREFDSYELWLIINLTFRIPVNSFLMRIF